MRTAPFVGREVELAALQVVVRASGPTRIPLVTGDPDVGKSRLVLEAAGATDGARGYLRSWRAITSRWTWLVPS